MEKQRLTQRSEWPTSQLCQAAPESIFCLSVSCETCCVSVTPVLITACDWSPLGPLFCWEAMLNSHVYLLGACGWVSIAQSLGSHYVSRSSSDVLVPASPWGPIHITPDSYVTQTTHVSCPKSSNFNPSAPKQCQGCRYRVIDIVHLKKNTENSHIRHRWELIL